MLDAASRSFRKPWKCRGNRGAGFDLYAGDSPGTFLEHDVHLGAITGPEVMERDGCLAPARLPLKVLKDERLKKRSEGGPLGVEPVCIQSEQSARRPPVSPMWSLGRFMSRLIRLLCHGGRRSSRNTRSSKIT